ncbi:MAG: GGDEF domain-containing protein [Pseudohongiellaceae bacterium]|nr:GGDEF domain-containing protein [Pseudohongiellaceae bacterium]
MNYRFYEWKIIAIFVVVFVLVQGGSYIAITINSNRVAAEAASTQLSLNSKVMRDLLNLRGSHLLLSTQALAIESGFIEAMETRESYIIEPEMRKHLVRLDAAAIVVSGEGFLARATYPEVARLEQEFEFNPALLNDDLGEREIMPLDSRHQTLFQVSSSPMVINGVSARLSIAYPLGEPQWQELGNRAGTSFMFLYKSDDQPWISHSPTFPAVISEALVDEFNAGNTELQFYELGDYSYALSLIEIDGPEDSLLYGIVGKSLFDVTAPFTRLQRTIFSLTVVALLVSVLAVFLVTRRFVAPLNTLAHVDNLTGVANRRLFDLSLQAMCTDQQANGAESFALLMADLDSFKQINDQLGHDAGDIVLRTIATRLLNSVRSSDLVSRYGGDEFAILLGGISEEEVRGLLASLQQSLFRPIRIHDKDIEVGVSIGIAMAPRDGNSAALLQSKADVAMYAAKSRQEHFAFYLPDMDKTG